MEEINWLQVLIGFISGGAFGAIIKIIVDNRKNSIQPISKNIDLTRIFDSKESPLDHTKIELKDGDSTETFTSLYSCKLRIINTGNNDYPNFRFGITAKNNTKIIRAETDVIDRHHKSEIENKNPDLNSQVAEVDFQLSPLNRKDYYIINLLLTNDSKQINVNDIELSTTEPIKWVDSDSTSKVIAEIARSTIVTVGPMTLRMK
jgi:hypothetical protein